MSASPDEARLAAAVDAIRRNFDRGASDYAAFEQETSFFQTLLESLLALAEPASGDSVLDVGCGTGASLALLRGRVGPKGRVVGLDNSPGMLAEAAARLGPDATLLCADGCDYASLFGRDFDRVVYNAALFLLPDARASLGSALAVLKPGGAVLFSNLDGVFVDGVPVHELLAQAGHAAGRHSLSPWAKVEAAARELPGQFSAATLELPLSVDLFRRFYGLEPMSAGLLPKTPYPERLKILDALAETLHAQGKNPVQRWMLGCVRPTPA